MVIRLRLLTGCQCHLVLHLNEVNMNIQGYRLEKVNEYRYKVVNDFTTLQFYLCEIAQYEPINKWYLVQKSLNHELSEQALKFIYESVKRLNVEVV